MQTQTVCYKNLGKFILNEISLITDLVYLCT